MFNKLYSSWNKKVDDIRQLTEKVLQYDEDVLLAIETGLKDMDTGLSILRDLFVGYISDEESE